MHWHVSMYEDEADLKEGEHHYIVALAATANHRSETGARWAPNAILALVCTLTFIPCPYPNYVALPKGMIIISSGAKMTHLHLLFKTHQILFSSLEMRRLAHLHLLPIIFKSWWEFWQICVSLEVGKKLDRVILDVPVIIPLPCIIARNAVSVMQIKILHWPNFLMNDSSLMKLPDVFCQKHSQQQPIKNQSPGHLLAVALLAGVMDATIKWCSWSVVNSYFWASTLQKLPYARHIAKHLHVIKGAFSKDLVFIFAPGVKRVGHCERSKNSGLPSTSSVYLSVEGLTVEKDPFVPLLCCFGSDTFPFVLLLWFIFKMS